MDNNYQDVVVDASQLGALTGNGSNNFGYVPSNQPLISQEGITKWLQNPKEIIRDIGLKLRGLEYNKQTKSYEKIREPLLLEHGIKSILSTLDFHINRTITLSNLEDITINRMAFDIIIALAATLQQDWVRCGLIKEKLPYYMDDKETNTIFLPNNHIVFTRKNKVIKILIPSFDVARYKLILKNLDNIIYSNLRRAKDGGERNFLTKITTEQIQSIKRDAPEQSGGGAMSKLLGVPPLFKK